MVGGAVQVNFFKRLNERIDSHTKRIAEMIAAFIVAGVFAIILGILFYFMIWLGILK